jgi:hypothetical protein
MPSPHQPHNRARYQNAIRQRYHSVIHWWIDQHPRGTRIACTMTAIGFLILAGFPIAATTGNTLAAGLLLLFGCGLIVLGGIVLLLDLIEWAARRLARDRKYCGCCASYKAQREDYSAGLCLAAHAEGSVPRTHYCPYFRYSERAMVRDRLWQKRYFLDRIRTIQADQGQEGSEE